MSRSRVTAKRDVTQDWVVCGHAGEGEVGHQREMTESSRVR